MKNNATDRAMETLRRQGEMLQKASKQIGAEFEKASKIVSSCEGTVYTVGFGKSGTVCAKLAATLRSAGKKSLMLNPVDALHGEMASVRGSDAAIVISSTGESEEIMRIVPWLKKKKVKIIALTPSDRSSLARASNVLLRTSQPADAADGCASYSTCLSALAIGDLLCLGILYSQDIEQGRGPASEQPPGEAIYTVADLISLRPANPTAPENMIFKDALLELTAKGLGAISVVDADGKLSGILTDGDIRRLLQKSQGSLTRLFLTNADTVMTRKPKNIGLEKTVFDALRIMEDSAITVLPVVDKTGRPAGMIHLHDLMQMGLRHRVSEEGAKRGSGKRAKKK